MREITVMSREKKLTVLSNLETFLNPFTMTPFIGILGAV